MFALLCMDVCGIRGLEEGDVGTECLLQGLKVNALPGYYEGKKTKQNKTKQKKNKSKKKKQKKKYIYIYIYIYISVNATCNTLYNSRNRRDPYLSVLN